MKIGLSKSIITHNGFDYDAIDQGWYQTLTGQSIFLIPNTLNQNFDNMANELDSLILTGGESFNLKRMVENELSSRMIEKGKPVLGVAESALHIAESLAAKIEIVENHYDLPHPIFYHREVLEVNSFHNRCIKSMHNDVNILCMDYLGNIEAFIHNNVAGIMWNPEKMEKPWIPPEIAYMLRI